MSKLTAEFESGAIVLPRRISLAIAAAFAAQLGFLVYHYAAGQAGATAANAAAIMRIERLERDLSALPAIDGRTIRMEADIQWIKSALQRRAEK